MQTLIPNQSAVVRN